MKYKFRLIEINRTYGDGKDETVYEIQEKKWCGWKTLKIPWIACTSLTKVINKHWEHSGYSNVRFDNTCIKATDLRWDLKGYTWGIPFQMKNIQTNIQDFVRDMNSHQDMLEHIKPVWYCDMLWWCTLTYDNNQLFLTWDDAYAEYQKGVEKEKRVKLSKTIEKETRSVKFARD